MHTQRISQNLCLWLSWRTTPYRDSEQPMQTQLSQRYFVYMCLASKCTTDGLSRAVIGSPIRNQPGAYLAHTPKSSAGTFLASPLLRTLGKINRDPIFLAISRYICLANGCIVVRSFRVVVESPARDESSAYPAHTRRISQNLRQALSWRTPFYGDSEQPMQTRLS